MKNRTRNGAASPGCGAGAPAEADDRVWRLPSGQTLAEFALRSGLASPRLLLAGSTRPAPLGILLRRSTKD